MFLECVCKTGCHSARNGTRDFTALPFRYAGAPQRKKVAEDGGHGDCGAPYNHVMACSMCASQYTQSCTPGPSAYSCGTPRDSRWA